MTGTSGGSGERDATQPLRDKEEGLASVEVEANRGTEGPSLSTNGTMWSAAERSPGEPTRKTKLESMYAVASVHNNSQSTVLKMQAGGSLLVVVVLAQATSLSDSYSLLPVACSSHSEAT